MADPNRDHSPMAVAVLGYGGPWLWQTRTPGPQGSCNFELRRRQIKRAIRVWMARLS